MLLIMKMGHSGREPSDGGNQPGPLGAPFGWRRAQSVGRCRFLDGHEPEMSVLGLVGMSSKNKWRDVGLLALEGC